jgi:hypothetical protein
MALTMTRTRTQTTLTRLALLIARVHSELAFVERQLANTAGLTEARQRGLEARQATLRESRQALYVTLRHFDPALNPEGIGEVDTWLKPFGHGAKAFARYLCSLDVSG